MLDYVRVINFLLLLFLLLIIIRLHNCVQICHAMQHITAYHPWYPAGNQHCLICCLLEGTGKQERSQNNSVPWFETGPAPCTTSISWREVSTVNRWRHVHKDQTKCHALCRSRPYSLRTTPAPSVPGSQRRRLPHCTKPMHSSQEET